MYKLLIFALLSLNTILGQTSKTNNKNEFLNNINPIKGKEFKLSSHNSFRAYNAYDSKEKTKYAYSTNRSNTFKVIDAYKFPCKTDDCYDNYFDSVNYNKYIIELQFTGSKDTIYLRDDDYNFKNLYFTEEMNSVISSFKKEKEIKIIVEEKEIEWSKTKSTCEYSINEVDEFNSKNKKYTKNYSLYYSDSSYGIIGISLINIDNELYVNITSNYDLGCTSSYENNKSYASVKLKNGDILKFYHRGELNCSEFNLFGRLSKSEVARLKKSPIKVIRLSGTKYNNDYKDIVWRSFFIDKLNCIE